MRRKSIRQSCACSDLELALFDLQSRNADSLQRPHARFVLLACSQFYLYGLLAALLLLASLDCNVRRVHLLLLRVQWSVAYFFAGCAKCSAEFLIRREPLRAYLQMGVASGMPLAPLAPLLTAEPTVAAAAIFALTFDLGAAFALWFQPTFKPFCALAAAFHLTNAMMFSTIGSFPFVSLASCLLFTEATPLAKPMEQPQRKGEQCKAGSGKAGSGKADRSNGHRISDNKSRQSILAAISVWCAVQILLPLRHHLLSDDVAWTKLGNEFAWRMMADTTDGWVDLTLTLHPTNRSFRLHPQSLPPAPVTLTSHSIRQLLASPGNLQQYIVAERAAAAKALLGGTLGSEASAERNRFRPGGASNHGRGGRRLSVHAECWKSVNGRPYQRYCDPTFDFGGQDGPDAPLSLWSMSPRWMLPRLLGPWGAPSEADVAADAAANEWRARGYTAEAFVDAPGRPPWRDTILHSSGYREARVLCTHGRLAMRPAAPLGAAGDPRQLDAAARVEWTRLSVGESAQLRIGTAHELRNDDALPASWIYVMR